MDTQQKQLVIEGLECEISNNPDTLSWSVEERSPDDFVISVFPNQWEEPSLNRIYISYIDSIMNIVDEVDDTVNFDSDDVDFLCVKVSFNTSTKRLAIEIS